MRTLNVWPIAAASVIACANPLLAGAQQPADVPPPKLEKLEEGEAPAVTIRGAEAERKITETRERGRVTEVQVRSGNSTYYLKPNVPAGSALPGDVQSDRSRPAQWQVKEFDWGGGPEAREAAAQAAAGTPAPPETAVAPARKK